MGGWVGGWVGGASARVHLAGSSFLLAPHADAGASTPPHPPTPPFPRPHPRSQLSIHPTPHPPCQQLSAVHDVGAQPQPAACLHGNGVLIASHHLHLNAQLLRQGRTGQVRGGGGWVGWGGVGWGVAARWVLQKPSYFPLHWVTILPASRWLAPSLSPALPSLSGVLTSTFGRPPSPPNAARPPKTHTHTHTHTHTTLICLKDPILTPNPLPAQALWLQRSPLLGGPAEK